MKMLRNITGNICSTGYAGGALHFEYITHIYFFAFPVLLSRAFYLSVKKAIFFPK